MPKKLDKTQEQKPEPKDVLLKMLNTPPETQKKIVKAKKTEK